ncbi:hypothetical protein EDB89DRAFT_1135088 [Lactarius sanguifluus]|nr:hypothetical protein EDB89DRAFT_1135088 [Lactarius sanguifluus]
MESEAPRLRLLVFRFFMQPSKTRLPHAPDLFSFLRPLFMLLTLTLPARLAFASCPIATNTSSFFFSSIPLFTDLVTHRSLLICRLRTILPSTLPAGSLWDPVMVCRLLNEPRNFVGPVRKYVLGLL